MKVKISISIEEQTNFQLSRLTEGRANNKSNIIQLLLNEYLDYAFKTEQQGEEPCISKFIQKVKR